MPPAATIVDMSMKDFAELIVRRLAAEQIEPLKSDVAEISERLARVETAVIGNGTPSLSAQIHTLARECSDCRERMHQRISDTRRSMEATPPEVAETLHLKEQVKGGLKTLGWIGGLIAFGLKLLELLKGAK